MLCQNLTIGDKGNRGKITIADGKGGGDFWKTPIVQPLRMRDLVPFRCEPLFVFEAFGHCTQMQIALVESWWGFNSLETQCVKQTF